MAVTPHERKTKEFLELTEAAARSNAVIAAMRKLSEEIRKEKEAAKEKESAAT